MSRHAGAGAVVGDEIDDDAKPSDVKAMPLLARRLATLAAVTLGAILPMVMVVANKSAPASLGAATLFATLSACLGGQGPALWRRYTGLAVLPATMLILSFGMVCVLSLAWSVDPALTRRGLVEAFPELLFAFMMAAAWPLVARRGDIRWLVGGLFGAAALMIVEHRFGMPLHVLFRARGEAWDLKRSAIPPVLLLWPALAGSLRRGRSVLAIGLLGAAAAGIVVSHSGAPGFALVTALGLGLLARFAPKVAIPLATLGIVLLIVLAPWTGTLTGRFLPSGAASALAEEHAAHRMRIWSAFEERVPDHWILGHGFDASFKVSTAPRPGGAPPGPGNAEMLDNHPHDVFLELWVELGIFGAAAVLGIVAWTFGRLRALTPRRLAPRLALLSSVVGIGLVGLSAWQPWWLATIAASLLWFDFLAARCDGEDC